MADLTVGYVSGIIAAVAFLIQVFIPLAISLIVVGMVVERHTAVSWSVVTRLIHSSLWPVILGADTTASTNVSRRIQFAAWLQPIALALVAVAATVTPLGLYEELSPGKVAPTPFRYASDTTPFGKTTPRRSEYQSLRICRFSQDGLVVACPGAPPDFSEIDDNTTASSLWPSSIDIFTSGFTTETVSSMFDIEWRSYQVTHEVTAFRNGTTEFARGYYRQLSNFILQDFPQAVEGLILDPRHGGIGFRNHTIPVNTIEHGATWTEDTLFIEPETQCVNTNLTLEYVLTGASFSRHGVTDITLVDQGGFVDLNHNDPPVQTGDPQDDPGLYQTAYAAAWEHNLLTMLMFNVTTNGSNSWSYVDSHVGKRYLVGKSFVEPHSMQISPTFSDHLGLTYGMLDPNTTSGVVIGPNPLNITRECFDLIEEKCAKPHGDHLANMSAVSVMCGMLFGAADRIDGGDPHFPTAGSQWSLPIYSCASASKATIKEVTFNFNGSSNLSNLVVDRIQDKIYSDQAAKPLWGVENLNNFTMEDAQPLWGLVSEEIGNRDDVSTVQREYLWLPAYLQVSEGDPIPIIGKSGLPGNYFYASNMNGAYLIDDSLEKMWYSGATDASVYSQWQELSRSPSEAGKIINRLWTDFAANSVVGTKGWMNISPPDSSEPDFVPVTLLSPTVKYRLAFGVPAMIVLLITALMASVTLALLAFHRTGLQKLSIYLAKTSAGRILSSFLRPDLGNPLSPTGTWVNQGGSCYIRLGDGTDFALAEETQTHAVARKIGPLIKDPESTENA